MKNLLLIIALTIYSFNYAQIVNIPDVNFKNKLLSANTSNNIAKDINGASIVIDINNDNEIQVSEALNVYELTVVGSYQNRINNLTGVEDFTNLTSLNCKHNDLTNLDVSTNINLTQLNSWDNNLTNLDVSANINLTQLNFRDNNLTILDLSTNINLSSLDCSDNNLTILDLSTNINLSSLDCSDNNLTNFDVSANINLTQLNSRGNNLTNLDVSANISLSSLNCPNNNLTTLDLSTNINLSSLDCSYNNLTNLDVSANINLTQLNSGGNNLTNLDVSANISLSILNCPNNNLTILDLEANLALMQLACSANLITQLNLSANINLINLSCEYNNLTHLDLSSNTNLNFLGCSNSNLTYVNLKNGNNTNMSSTGWIFYDTPNLQVICVDDTLDTSFSNSLTSNLNHSVNITENCPNNIINGTARFDVDNNGCSSSDIALSNAFIVSNSGAYSFTSSVMNDASFTISAGIGNFTTSIQNLPPYWTASPNSYTNTFTSSLSTFVADFCITANQTINDVTVTILPTFPARPGFDTRYRIVYTNNGTTHLSGYVNFVFDFNSLSFLNASEPITSQTANSINFGYSNLAPFETRTIDLEFNVNAPTSSSPVNINDTLNYTASITPILNDNTINDNTFVLNQTVIGSYDPNNITCLEGSSIYLEDTDEYLHYLIRFQNSGTASAINVNVKNTLDSKLDWNTLTLENTSHTARVDIRNGNQVTFIFENINLPDENTDEPGSHGFIAYKIKPKNNVALGDEFSSVANIFFDYNTAIVTNTATTEIINNTTAIEEHNNSLAFSIYPVLAEDLITITSKETLQSITVYSNLGQLVLSNKEQITIDISNLGKGLYFVKVTDLKGNFGIQKIIKK